MNTCSTCRWWADKKHEWDAKSHPEVLGWRWCMNGDSLMIGTDRGGWPETGVYTSPDFGCNQWEEKTDATT